MLSTVKYCLILSSFSLLGHLYIRHTYVTIIRTTMKKILSVATTPKMKRRIFSIFFFFIFTLGPTAFAAGAEGGSGYGIIFLWIASLLLLARLSHLIERIGQPAVLGELLIGVILGNLDFFGVTAITEIKSNEIITFLSNLGVIILLFQIGLRSNIHKLTSVGGRAILVAAIGVIAPFLAGTFIVAPIFFPDLTMLGQVFIGAALVTTSVGITERVLKDLDILNAKEIRIILGAAIIDDVIGLIFLAVLTVIAQTGAITLGSIAFISFKAVAFLVAAIVLGYILAPLLVRLFSQVHASAGMKFTFAISTGLFIAYFAEVFGLEPIIGAFAAGLILDPIDFQYFNDPDIVAKIKTTLKDSKSSSRKKVLAHLDHYAHKHVEEIIDSLGYFLVPIFFIYTGMHVDLAPLFNIPVLLSALVISAIAFLAKFISGFAAGKENHRAIIGIGMVPRGEVGVVFASIGASLNIITPEAFVILILVINITTFVTPPLLAKYVKKINI